MVVGYKVEFTKTPDDPRCFPIFTYVSDAMPHVAQNNGWTLRHFISQLYSLQQGLSIFFLVSTIEQFFSELIHQIEV